LCYHGACLLKVVVAGSTHVRGYGMGRRKGKCVNRSPVVIISCKVLQDILTALLPKDLAQRVTYMDYGLHMLPRRMTTALQEIIEGIEEPSLVVLGYGLCGNGLRGIKAGRHCLLVPRVSDCISLLLGSHEAYKKEFGAVPGTYYLSRGWLEAEEIARFCARWDLRLEEILGSDGYVRQLVNLAQQLSNQAGEILPGGIAGAHATQCDRAQISPDEDYMVIPPGGEIRQALFVR